MGGEANQKGCQGILVVPGAVGVDFEPGSEIVDYDVAYDRCLEALKELAPVAEEYQVDYVDICLPTYLPAQYAASTMQHGFHAFGKQ